MHSKHEILTSKKTGVSFLLIFMLVLLFFPVACGKKEVKPVTQESKTAQEAFELAEAIKKAYEEKDKSALEENTTADGYRELIGAIKSFDRAELAFTPTWVEIKDSSVSLNISWKGAWTVRGTVTNESGLAVFVLEGSPLKLSKILRENPFRQPE
jgi:hypothetical protein